MTGRCMGDDIHPHGDCRGGGGWLGGSGATGVCGGGCAAFLTLDGSFLGACRSASTPILAKPMRRPTTHGVDGAPVRLDGDLAGQY